MADHNLPKRPSSSFIAPLPRNRSRHLGSSRNIDRYVPSNESQFRVSYGADETPRSPVKSNTPNSSPPKAQRKIKEPPSEIEVGEINAAKPRQQTSVMGKRDDADISFNKDEEPPAKRQKAEGSGEFMGTEKLLETGDYHDTIVLVGPQRKRCKLHHAILCQNSGYFRRLLRSPDKPTEIALPDVDPVVFDHVLQFLYHGDLPLPEDKSTHWVMSWLAIIFSSASFFDIPAMKKKTIAGCVEELSNPDYRRHYHTGGINAERLIKALKTLFACYETEEESIEQVLRPLVEYGFMPQVLGDKEMRHILEGLPKLMIRLLDLQGEVITWLHSHGGKKT